MFSGRREVQNRVSVMIGPINDCFKAEPLRPLDQHPKRIELVAFHGEVKCSFPKRRYIINGVWAGLQQLMYDFHSALGSSIVNGSSSIFALQPAIRITNLLRRFISITGLLVILYPIKQMLNLSFATNNILTNVKIIFLYHSSIS